MEEKEVLLTQEGYNNLEKELNYLKTEKRAVTVTAGRKPEPAFGFCGL